MSNKTNSVIVLHAGEVISIAETGAFLSNFAGASSRIFAIEHIMDEYREDRDFKKLASNVATINHAGAIGKYQWSSEIKSVKFNSPGIWEFFCDPANIMTTIMFIDFVIKLVSEHCSRPLMIERVRYEILQNQNFSNELKNVGCDNEEVFAQIEKSNEILARQLVDCVRKGRITRIERRDREDR